MKEKLLFFWSMGFMLKVFYFRREAPIECFKGLSYVKKSKEPSSLFEDPIGRL